MNIFTIELESVVYGLPCETHPSTVAALMFCGEEFR